MASKKTKTTIASVALISAIGLGGLQFISAGDVETVETVIAESKDDELVVKAKPGVITNAPDLNEAKIIAIRSDLINQKILDISDLDIARRNDVSRAQVKLVQKKMQEEKIKRDKEKEKDKIK